MVGLHSSVCTCKLKLDLGFEVFYPFYKLSLASERRVVKDGPWDGWGALWGTASRGPSGRVPLSGTAVFHNSGSRPGSRSLSCLRLSPEWKGTYREHRTRHLFCADPNGLPFGGHSELLGLQRTPHSCTVQSSPNLE